jgi:photosystem II stability/assembly factor-like uncharacterized protein
MRTLLGIGVLVLATTISAAPSSGAEARGSQPVWKRVDLHSHQGLRGLDVVDGRTAWVSCDGGGVSRTTDGGATWKDVRPKAEKPLLFRDVEADSARVAQVMAAGLNGSSRIYKTVDGGRHWRLTYKNAELNSAFFDCMTMFPDGLHGLVMSDPVDGRFRILATSDAGDHWRKVDPKGMPKAKDGEFGFAASGTCITTAGISDAWFASGGAASRVFRSTDYGTTWTAVKVPIPSDPGGGGVFSLAFQSSKVGIAVGGSFLDPDNGRHMTARTFDGGRTWVRGGNVAGYRSGVAWVPFSRTAVAVGPNGTDITSDGGRTWTPIGRTGFNAVQCVGTLSTTCWAAGPDGIVARLVGLPKG